LAAAEAALTVKLTKTATDSKRIASSKIVAIQKRLDQLDNPELLPSDSRIFPGSCALVMVWLAVRLKCLEHAKFARDVMAVAV
jgi:hypothetical protein